MTTLRQDPASTRASAADEDPLLADLLDHGAPTAPHVLTRLRHLLDDDDRCVREAAVALTPAQRAGRRMLPDPLPLAAFSPAGEHAVDDVIADSLLCAALSTTGDVAILCAATGLSSEDLGADGRLLLSRGRFAFAEPGAAVRWQHRAAHADIARAHARLADAFEAAGDGLIASWHRGRGARERMPEIAAPLTAAARTLNETGHPHRAFAVAVEASHHAEGEALDEARLIAGVAALAAGCMEDAAEWLGSLFPHGAAPHRAQATAGLLIARTCVHGAVPAIDPATLRPSGGDGAHWHDWARTAGLCALMCAERGAVPAMREWLAELRHAGGRADAGTGVRDSAVALCWMLTGETDDVPAAAPGLFSGGMAAALRTGLAGDAAGGMSMLVEADLRHEIDPLVAGFEHSPLVDAYLAVTEALLLSWAGEIGGARDRLTAAAGTAPIGIPFAGLGIVLAHRLGICVDGRPGTTARALAATAPAGIRIDRLGDRALAAYLAGSVEQGAADLSLWHDRGAPGPVPAVPALDEVGPVVDPVRVEPPDLATARRLRARVRALPDAGWRHEFDEIAHAGRALSSGFERGRLEAVLGSACIIRGDVSAGRRHLRVARRLLRDAGAHAWSAAIDDRLDRLTARLHADVEVVTMPITVIADPFETSRVAWAPLMTDREVDVAVLVAQGRSNREIAADLDISVRTVEVHIGRIFAKLGVRNRVELSVLAHRTGRHL